MWSQLMQNDNIVQYFWRMNPMPIERSLGATVKLLPCNLKVTDLSHKNNLLQYKIRLSIIDSMWFDPSSGVSCTTLYKSNIILTKKLQVYTKNMLKYLLPYINMIYVILRFKRKFHVGVSHCSFSSLNSLSKLLSTKFFRSH